MAEGYEPRPVTMRCITIPWGKSLTFNAKGNILMLFSGDTMYMLWSNTSQLITHRVFGTIVATFTRDSNFNITVSTESEQTMTAYWMDY